MSDKKLQTTPTGCPGPIPGTKVWRCDGVNCVYGPYCFDSCKQAIADRGYVLRISSDLVEEAAEAAELHRQTAQGQLEKERREYAEERVQTQITLDNLAQNVRNANSEAETFANLYIEQMLCKEAAKRDLDITVETLGVTEDQLSASCEHCTTLLQELAVTRDERDYYKLLAASLASGTDNLVGQEATSEATDCGVANSVGASSSGVRDTGDINGTVTSGADVD